MRAAVLLVVAMGMVPACAGAGERGATLSGTEIANAVRLCSAGTPHDEAKDALDRLERATRSGAVTPADVRREMRDSQPTDEAKLGMYRIYLRCVDGLMGDRR